MGTLLIEGKTLFPRARKEAEPPGPALMIDRILSLAAESGVASSLAILEIDDAWTLRNESRANGLQRVLKTLAGLLHKQTPAELLFDRWGPAGFLCVHPGATLAKTLGLLEKLQCLLYGEIKKTSPGKPVTFSAGLAGFPEHGSTRVELLRRAEEALYVAQTVGKGTIQFPPDEELKDIKVALSLVQVHRLSHQAEREGTDAEKLIREAVDEFLRRSQRGEA